MRGQVSSLGVRQIFSSLMITMLCCSCGQVGELSLSSAAREEAAGTDEFVLVNIQACNDLANTGQMQTLKQKVTFEDTRVETGLQNICPFAGSGEDSKGNLSMVDGQMRARYEQKRSLQLPPNAVICDIKLNNNLQSFRYDDVFFLTFNDYILATNNKSAVRQKLSPEIVNAMDSLVAYNIYTYDWMSLRTARFENVVDDFCLGEEAGLGQCTWPVTEQAGQIQLKWKPEVFLRLTANRPAEQSFKFVITGDNDKAVDCYHEKLEFDVSVSYFLK